MRRLAVLVALALSGLTPPAHAATVGLEEGTVTVMGSETTGERLRVRGDAAEVRVSGNVAAGEGCLPAGPGEVACAPPGCRMGQACEQPILRLALRLGARSDSFVGSLEGAVAFDAELGAGADAYHVQAGGEMVVRGGTGGDAISTGPSGDRLEGGDGNDRLGGGDGPDLLDGGAGDDAFKAAERVLPLEGSPDAFLGGPGNDLVTYDAVSAPVRVTLDGRADDGVEGEGDSVATDVERVWGGNGPDRLAGGDGMNVLRGGPGNDELLGGGGADLLEGENGDDVLFGDGRDAAASGGAPDGADYLSGAAGNDALDGGEGVDGYGGGEGDDRIQARGPALSYAPHDEDLACDGGADTVLIDWNDGVGADCEGVDRGAAPPGYGPAPPRDRSSTSRGPGPQPLLGIPTFVGGQVLLPVVCAAPAGGRCRAQASVTAVTGRRSPGGGLRSRRRVVGRASPLVPAGASTVVVGVGSAGRRLVRRLRGVRAVVDLRVRVHGGATARAARPLRLTRAGLLPPRR